MDNNSFSVEVIEHNIGLICVDVKGESQNTLRAEFADELNLILDDLEKLSVSGIIIYSGKKNSFIVGADINMLNALETTEQVLELSKAGYQIFDRLENLAVPVVAEIHGACMGGGLELALACHARVCSNHSSTLLALPEVKLGLLPGGGGTQRLPPLIGIAEALAMMTTGRNIRAAKALKMGLVDVTTDPLNLRQASMRKLRDLVNTADEKSAFDYRSLLTMKGWQTILLEKNQPGLNFLFQQAYKKVRSKTHGNYPAPEKIIDCVVAWSKGERKSGYETEATQFSELVLSQVSKQLINVFFATTALKKDRFIESDVKAVPIEKLIVLGGGLMGAGIALVSAEKTRASVRIKDISESAINHALKYVWDRLLIKVKKRHYSQHQAKEKMSKISAGTDFTGFTQADLVIEAVFESLELKHQMIRDVEQHCQKNTIFASNTSSIPLTEIAAVAKRPENIIGMHYFSPVDKMPLLELIITDKTSDRTIATAVEFGRQQGKTVIVVNDGAGFYTSRILSPYMNEAGHLIAEGIAVEDIDTALVNFGYPVGPITLLDEVGIDIGTKITPILEDAFGERMTPAKVFTRLVESGRLGRKNKKGFYDYTEKKYSIKSHTKRPVDQSVYDDIGVQPKNSLAAEIIVERCHLMMVNEAIRCLGEGILQSPRDGDIGAIFGLGFPAYLGGPFRYADQLGLPALIKKLEHYQQQVDIRFTPCEYLMTMASDEKSFYG